MCTCFTFFFFFNKLECPSLNDPENGRVDAEGYNQGNVAEYICNNEYYLSGAKYRKCQNNYTWSLEPPTCKF